MPIIILVGFKLSQKAFPSLKNSGQNKNDIPVYFLHILLVNPLGTVDLIIIVASGEIKTILEITSSTTEVLRTLVFLL